MKNNLVVKASAWYFLSNIFVKGFAYLSIPIFTRMLSQAEFGEYNNFVSWISILAIIVTFSLKSSVSVARFDYRDNLYDFISSILLINIFLVSFFFLITRINVPGFERLFCFEDRYIVIMFAYILVSVGFEIFQIEQRFKYHYKLSAFLSVISVLSSTGIALIAVVLLDNKLLARIYGNYMPLIVLYSIIYIWYLLKAHHIKIEYIRYAFRYSLPLVPHLLGCVLLDSSDKIMITAMCGDEETAIYSLAYTCAMAVKVVNASMNDAFSPWLGEKIDRKEYKTVYNMSTKYIMFFALFCVGLMLISPEIVLVAGGDAYRDAIDIIPVIMAGAYFQFVYCMYVNIEQYKKKNIGIAIGTASAALINIVLNYICINAFGYKAAAYTTLVSYIALLVFHYFLVRKIGMTTLYNTKNIIIISTVILLLNFLVQLLLPFVLIRYMVIVVYVLCIVVYIKKIKLF